MTRTSLLLAVLLAALLDTASADAKPKTKPAAKASAATRSAPGTEWDGLYEADNTDSNAILNGGLLCPGDGRPPESKQPVDDSPDATHFEVETTVVFEVNTSKYLIKNGRLMFNVVFLDVPGGPENGRRVIPISVPLKNLTKEQMGSGAASARARGEEWLQIPAIKLRDSSTGTITAYDRIHVTADIAKLAPKGRAQATMGSGRTANVIVRLGGEDDAVQCSNNDINGSDFTGPDRSKGSFCSQSDTSCYHDRDCCSKVCNNTHDGARGTCR